MGSHSISDFIYRFDELCFVCLCMDYKWVRTYLVHTVASMSIKHRVTSSFLVTHCSEATVAWGLRDLIEKKE